MKRKIMIQKFKNGARKVGKFLAGAVLAAGLILVPGKTRAEEPAKGRFFYGLYDQGKSPIFGFGISKGLKLPKGFRVDALMAVSSREGNPIEMAELDITTPSAGILSGTIYMYKDNFYYVDNAICGMINLKDLHIAGEYLGNNWGDVFAKYVIKIGDKLVLVPKIVMLFSDERVEAIGGELKLDLDIGEVSLFGKSIGLFVPDGTPMNLNALAGMEFEF